MAGEIDDVVIELRPCIMLWLDVHRLIIVEELKRERQNTVGTLVEEIERGGLSKGCEQGVTRKGAGRHVDETFG